MTFSKHELGESCLAAGLKKQQSLICLEKNGDLHWKLKRYSKQMQIQQEKTNRVQQSKSCRDSWGGEKIKRSHLKTKVEDQVATIQLWINQWVNHA